MFESAPGKIKLGLNRIPESVVQALWGFLALYVVCYGILVTLVVGAWGSSRPAAASGPVPPPPPALERRPDRDPGDRCFRRRTPVETASRRR